MHPLVSDALRRVLGISLGRLRTHAPRPLRLPPPLPANLPESGARFALVTPALDQERFIGAAVASVATQDYRDIDYCVKDGGSSDRTIERAEAAAAGRAQLVRAPDTGLAQAVNQGFACVRGELMGWLNGDDLMLPGTLRFVAAYFARNPDVDVVYGHRILVDAQGQEIGRWLLPAHDDAVLSYADYVPQETLFWRRAAWERAGGRLDESFRFAVDWDLLLRFRATRARMVRLPRFLGCFRVHPDQMTSRDMATLGLAEQARLRERALGRAPSRLALAVRTAPYLLRHAALRQVARLGPPA